MLLSPVCLLPLVLPWTAGCGQPSLPLAPVHGKISYNGMLLQNGTVVFTPDASRGTTGPQSHAEIQSDGSYTLRSGKAYGAVPGWHRVTVAAVSASAPAGNGEPFSVPQSLLPDRYRDPQLSKLVCEVKADQPNVFEFNLVD
jgi:hypothetical protein